MTVDGGQTCRDARSAGRTKEMTLYEITDSYRQLLWIAGDPEVDPETVQETMDDLDDELEVKADNYVTVIKALETDNAGDMLEITRLRARVATRERNIKNMKNSLLEAMRAAGKKKLPTEHYQLSEAKNGGVQPLKLAPVDQIPNEYLIMKPEADTAKIRKAISEGMELEFASLEERGTHLTIR